MVSSKELYLSLNEHSIFVKQWNPARLLDPIPVFLLHDSLGCVALWRNFPELICKELGKTVYAYDRLGFGRSSELLELPSVDFVLKEKEVLRHLLVELKINNFDLFGHSVGGAMAIAGAAHLKGCRSLVVESAQVFVEAKTLEGIQKAKVSFLDKNKFDKLTKYHGSKAKWVLNAWTEVWLSKDFSHWNLEPVLKELSCPTLAIYGDLDEFASVAFPETIRRLAVGSTMVKIIVGGGHVPHRENPDLILELLKEFYRS